MQLGFHPMAVVGKLAHKQKIKKYLHGEIQYAKPYKNTENKIENNAYKRRKQA